jgi:hypothetical protein
MYKEIKMRAVAKSYMRKGFLIHEEMRKYLPIMRRPLVLYDFATAPFWISLDVRKILFSFLSVKREYIERGPRFLTNTQPTGSRPYVLLVVPLFVWKVRQVAGDVTALQGKYQLCIPFLGTALPQSQFPHSCVY